jgi:HEPN domain-containing protein
MKRLEEAKRWMNEAHWDLGTARSLHELKRFNACAFYCQQAGEKATKALLYYIGEPPFGHSVRELLERFEKSSKENISDLLSSARELDRHYIPSRYPNVFPSGTPHEAYDEETSKKALECAERILAYVKKFMKI